MFKYLHDAIAKHRQRGVSTLPMMLLMGGIIIEIAIAMAFLAYYFNTLNFSSRLAAEALETARAGAQDAIIKVVLNKTCPDANCPSSYSFSTSNGRTAAVTIVNPTGIPCSSDPAAPPTTQIRVDSVGTALNKNRKMEALLQVDCLTGKVDTQSFGEIAF